jgi:hypothetical protein
MEKVPGSTRTREMLVKTSLEYLDSLPLSPWAQADIRAALGRTAETLAALDRLLAVGTEFLRAHPNDEHALSMMSDVYNNSSVLDSALADTLFELGRVAEAKAILLECHAVLDRLQKQSTSLRVEYAFGQNGVRLGVLYGSLANDPKLSPATRLGYWRQSQESLRWAVASLQKVTASVAIEPLDRKVLDAGLRRWRGRRRLSRGSD